MSAMTLWLAQRITGAALAVFVLVHLATMIVAVRGGLDAAEIATRFGSTVLWPTFYALFVLCAAVHAPIGIRNVLTEHTQLAARTVDVLAALLGVVLLAMGAIAVVAIWQLSSRMLP